MENMEKICMLGTSANRYPQITIDNKIALDWLEFTCSTPLTLGEVITQVLGFDLQDFEDLGHGALGYTNISKHIYSDIRILYGGNNDTIHVELSGSACKYYFEFVDLVDFLIMIMQEKFSITRLDICYDDFTNRFYTPEVLNDLAQRGLIISKWKQNSFISSSSFGSNMDMGATFYFGKMGSKIFCRVYDKRSERKYNTGIDPNLDWVRWELVLRKPNTEAFLDKFIMNLFDLKLTFQQVLGAYIRIVKTRDYVNVSRSPVDDKWQAFLDYVPSSKLEFIENNFDICNTSRWLENQCGAALSAVHRIDPDWLSNHVNPNLYKKNPKYCSIE